MRINCTCPYATETAMIGTFKEAGEEEGLPMKSAEVVARIMLGVCVDEKINRESVYV